MVIKEAQEVLRIEAEGILAMIDRVGPEFTEAVELIYSSSGRVVVTGIGKSGIVGRKIVATLNSTGTPAVSLHPIEALHGDLGMVTSADILLALSHSGETEVNEVVSIVRGLGIKVIAMTGNLESTLAKNSDIILDVGVAREACPLGLAPTASTTAATAMGDALAVALLNRRQFNSDDFKRFHPGGNLGERLSLQVKEVMTKGQRVPRVSGQTLLSEALQVMDKSKLGVLLIVDEKDILKGVFTDGDLRRCLTKNKNIRQMTLRQVMTRKPKTISENQLAVEALEIMQSHEITILPIVEPSGRLKGVVHLHALLGKGKFRFD
ncbi:MAG: KpsF/GutQ family sugar-phosphate isomerase [Deltaproteobacteria bacterium]|nr:KpsF/GutQ family sugar-phosphate isomerase [Deltaproteobacteria bacterium]MBW2052136.1 KpsF/GutQ family sugar-phosphate isomerase [Deltaproteobacteria bacterium]MBW2140644.1 KpsF/GutQ family sugar-phosphate isomerase [Deltaproteobacteria bacterium]MBW2322449.1 KpsF/GutQ family sugar-phosphate isomerase [Deltaproteobacteria bacterium]